jgi:hypothetical protein
LGVPPDDADTCIRPTSLLAEESGEGWGERREVLADAPDPHLSAVVLDCRPSTIAATRFA